MIRIITAIISAFIFSLIFVFFDSGAEGYFYAIFIYSLPIFIIGGGLYSMLADAWVEKMDFNNLVYQYIITFLIYGVGGIFVNVFLYISIFTEGFNSDATSFHLILGIGASLIFLHTMIILKRICYYLTRYKIKC